MTEAADDIRRILAEWRARHGWQPGAVWNPHTATYEMEATAATATEGEAP